MCVVFRSSSTWVWTLPNVTFTIQPTEFPQKEKQNRVARTVVAVAVVLAARVVSALNRPYMRLSTRLRTWSSTKHSKTARWAPTEKPTSTEIRVVSKIKILLLTYWYICVSVFVNYLNVFNSARKLSTFFYVGTSSNIVWKPHFSH